MEVHGRAEPSAKRHWPSRRFTLAASGLGLAGVAVALRVQNATHYPILYGFDAPANWRYIDRLTRSWTLPELDADWSTGHPPFFYYLAAAVCRTMGDPERQSAVILVRLLIAATGLLAVALAVALVRRVDPAEERRALIAGALLLFLPVHVYMSAMLSEEILASALTSLAVVGVAWDLAGPRPPRRGNLRAAVWGAAAGLALLTKLSGLLVVVAGSLAYALEARGGKPRPAALRAAVFLGIALLVGGWWYARNWVRHGFFYPYALETHEIMFTYPPGERRLGDYLRVPFETWTDPQVLSPRLLRSVWGTTYASLWFDAHRHFLPSQGDAVRRAGTAILLLALVPTAAFAMGLRRGLRRSLDAARGPDPPLLILSALTVAGYVLFTWRNPWFPALKGSFLLGLSVPFAFYASEVLAAWTQGTRPRALSIAACLGLLLIGVAATFTQGLVFEKADTPGFDWVFPGSP